MCENRNKQGIKIGVSHILPMATASSFAEIIKREHDYCISEVSEDTCD